MKNKLLKLSLGMLIATSSIHALDVKTWKVDNPSGNDVWIEVEDKPNNPQDWIGVYKKSDNNEWKNVLKWAWAKNTSQANDPGDWYKFEGLADGTYEARFFYNNSYKVEDKVSFKVGTIAGATLTSWHESYTTNEPAWIEIHNKRDKVAHPEDWIGIFQKGSNSDWNNVKDWKWVKDNDVEQSGSQNWYRFDDLTTGQYEARLFYNNEYGADATVRSSIGFSVHGGGNIKKKKLILHSHSGGWAPAMAPNLIRQHEYIKTLPFSGYSVVGNSYTDKVMVPNKMITYNEVWDELKGLKGLYPTKSNFLLVWMKNPGDLWNDDAWNKVSNNFKVVAKVAKDLGFAGIIYDDEAYDHAGKLLINYDKNGCFDYEKANHQGKKIAYANPNHTFFEHTEKMTLRFKSIMESMVTEFPNIEVLYYHSPAEGHVAADSVGGYRLITGVGPESGHEMLGAMFLGLKRGLSKQASLHDMGEDYTLRTKRHFDRSYEWRKHTIASDATNDNIDATEHWTVPVRDRNSWNNDIKVGFMMSNLPYNGGTPVDTGDKVGLIDMKNSIEKSIDKSDKYVVFYSASSTNNEGGRIKLDWLQGKHDNFDVNPDWMKMMKGIYNRKLK